MKPLIAIASVVALIAVFAVWLKREALDTDAWTQTSGGMLADDDVKVAVADFLVDRITVNLGADVVRERLGGSLRDSARQALADPGVRAAWEQANRSVHMQLLAIIDSGTAGGGSATIELDPVLAEITSQLGIGPQLATSLPARIARLEILREDQLEAVQSGARLLRSLAYPLALLAIALYAAAIFLARGRRREAVGVSALSLVLIAAVILLGRWLGGTIAAAALSDAVSADDAIGAIWSIATSSLATAAYVLAGAGFATVAVVLVLGRFARETAQPSAQPY